MYHQHFQLSRKSPFDLAGDVYDLVELSLKHEANNAPRLGRYLEGQNDYENEDTLQDLWDQI